MKRRRTKTTEARAHMVASRIRSVIIEVGGEGSLNVADADIASALARAAVVQYNQDRWNVKVPPA
jgi:hypothetical protein